LLCLTFAAIFDVLKIYLTAGLQRIPTIWRLYYVYQSHLNKHK
jgi:hypothetical protein